MQQLLLNRTIQKVLEKSMGFLIAIIFLYHYKIRSIDPKQLFPIIWRSVMRFPLSLVAMRAIKHPHQLLPQEWLMIRMLNRFRKYDLPINIDVNLNALAAQETINNKQPAMYLTLHNGINFILKDIVNFGLPTTTIANDPQDIINHGAIYLNKIEEPIQFITRNAYCLIKLRANAKAGNNIYLCVDYEEGEDYRFKYVAQSFFSFGTKLNLPIYFVKEVINIDGSVDITLVKNEKSDATESAQDFIHYVQTSYPHFKRDLTVKAYGKQ